MPKSIVRSALLLLSLCVTQLVISGVTLADEPEGRPSIDVQGTGTVTTAADAVRIDLGVESFAATAGEALNANTAAVERIIAALEHAQVRKKDIQTQRFSVAPRYDRVEGRRDGELMLAGFTVSNQLSVMIRSLDDTGELIDQMIAAGANRVQNLQFLVTDTEALMDEARKRAFADARRKAVLYAQFAGVNLGKVMRLSETVQSGPRPMMMADAGVSSARSIPIEAGDQSLSVNIMVSFAIE